MTDRVKAGIVGCGNISNAYFGGCRFFDDFLEVVACADLDRSRAEAKAKEWGIPVFYDEAEVIAWARSRG